MKRSTLENTAFCIVLGVGLCADSLSTTPGGWWIMAGGLAAAAALYCAGQHMAYLPERERTRSRRKRRSAPDGPEHARSQTSAENKTATPQSRRSRDSSPCRGADIGQKESRNGGSNTAAAGETKRHSNHFTPPF